MVSLQLRLTNLSGDGSRSSNEENTLVEPQESLDFSEVNHTLGVASGAAGVDQGGALVDGDPSQSGVQCGLTQTVSSAQNVLRKSLPAGRNIDLEPYLPAEDTGIVWNSSVLDNFPQVRKITSVTPDLVQLSLILHNEDVALTVLQDVPDGLGSICGVNARGKSSSKNGRNV